MNHYTLIISKSQARETAAAFQGVRLVTGMWYLIYHRLFPRGVMLLHI